MKRILSIAAVVSILLSAFAADSARGQTGDFGLGIMVGEPTGISIRTFLDRRNALGAGLAWSLSDDSNFHLHVDYLRHNFRILQNELDIEEGELPLYYGIGGRVRADDDARVGIRFVLGVSYFFDEAPFDVFFEIAPIMDLAPETELNANAGIGFHYWF